MMQIKQVARLPQRNQVILHHYIKRHYIKSHKRLNKSNIMFKITENRH